MIPSGGEDTSNTNETNCASLFFHVQPTHPLEAAPQTPESATHEKIR